MIRRLRTAVVFLLIGAVVSVLVAWGCTLWLQKSGAKRAPLTEVESLVRSCLGNADYRDGRDPALPTFEHAGLALKTVWVDAKRGDSVGHTLLVAACRNPRPSASVMRVDAGWPLRVVRAEVVWRNDVGTGRGAESGYYNLVQIWPGWLPQPLLTWVPFHPLWVRLLASAVFYGLLAWTMFAFVPSEYRTRRLRRRGLCTHCGYNLCGTAHECCPECGKPVRPRNAEPVP